MPDMISEPQQQAKFAYSFVCNQINSDPYVTFALQVLSILLFEGPNATFYQSLIESDLGANFCPGYGYDTTTKQATFTVGLSNVENEQSRFKEIEKAINDTFKKVMDEGFEEKFLETALHQLEFSAKKTKDHFGLMLIS
jgi:Zn-dependent M16 (insulinase) family peptidase